MGCLGGNIAGTDVWGMCGPLIIAIDFKKILSKENRSNIDGADVREISRPLVIETDPKKIIA